MREHGLGCVGAECDGYGLKAARFYLGPNFRDNGRCTSLLDRDVEVVPKYSEHASNIVGGIVKMK